MANNLYTDFAACRAASGVLLQTPRLFLSWTDGLSSEVADHESQRTEAYLWLLVAHQFTKALASAPDYEWVNLSPEDMGNLKQVRNAWEHADEKLTHQRFPWPDPYMGAWLAENFPEGWVLVYSLSGDTHSLRIGTLVDVVKVAGEAESFRSYFALKYGLHNDET